MQKPLAEHEETNTFSTNLFAVSESLRIFAVTKCLFGRLSHNLIGILRLRKPFVRTAKGKGVYGRYHSVCSNFATLKLPTEVMQRIASALVYYIL